MGMHPGQNGDKLLKQGESVGLLGARTLVPLTSILVVPSTEAVVVEGGLTLLLELTAVEIGIAVLDIAHCPPRSNQKGDPQEQESISSHQDNIAGHGNTRVGGTSVHPQNGTPFCPKYWSKQEYPPPS